MAEAQHLSMDRLQIVFKIVERCNINCTYCYYFNMGDSSAFQHPPVVSIDSAERIANWLAVGCRELQTKELLITFHGGEPMMLKPEKFDAICRSFTDRLGRMVNVYFSIQTNGTILTDKWLSTLCKHRVNVGISIDGGRRAHDRYRLDRRGRSSFDKTEKNLITLVRAAAVSSDIMPSTISVLDCRNNYSEIYSYIRGLGVRRMSFLLPDCSFDDGFNVTEETARQYGEALFQVFKAWMTEDDPGVEIRFISEFLQNFRTREGDQPWFEESANKSRARQVLIVHSDGRVSVSDSYIPALSWYSNTPQCYIHDTSLRDFLTNEIFDEIELATTTLSVKCQECKWKSICRGGDLENRYSKENGFNNPSVYCDGYQWFFQNACKLLVENGYPAGYIERVVAN
ncbi:MAG: radical SAM protein [Methylocella sp.]